MDVCGGVCGGAWRCTEGCTEVLKGTWRGVRRCMEVHGSVQRCVGF